MFPFRYFCQRIVTLIAACVLTAACSTTSNDTSAYQAKPYVQVKHPEWTKNAVIYQINTRQFTQEGTFNAAAKQLPRLKDLGVDILWLMPIHPIGEENRKGTLGSPYSVKDYRKVNPEFGTLDDLKSFIKQAHEMGMYVILDWVANHSAWDNHLRFDHPDWYERDYKGDFRPTPWWDWSDIIDLDFSQPELRKYMTDAMKYWVEEVGVDGYRCDVAGFVPIDFWNQLRKELDEIKPVFMLAEWESRDLHAQAFDATYAWSWWEHMHNIAHGKTNVNSLFIYYSWNESAFPKEAMRMTMVSNHDKNAWEATQFEAFGEALEASIVLSVVGEGMPMIYNGQEAGNPRRLAFFEKDPIDWQPHPIGDLYKKLFKLKKQNTALWNAQWGATMVHVPNNHPTEVLSFVRQNQQDKVFAVFNFSGSAKTVKFSEKLYHGQYIDFTTAKQAVLTDTTELEIPAWGFKVFSK
ncbi:alpha-amylase family glycosyl hydrolase [Catenovulum agarivorans]|uniref:alpha-amylase family glycosyl hydrolase n=1 Tax=Catenovulum agarivorans TaxID=1172192 RepID=UPI000304C869|nr:alpha-amylase family glycosyl hydrolase [Catenovulum agarivorans]